MRPLVLGIVLLAAVAQAQSPTFDKAVCDVSLLTLKPVKTELKITEAQRAKMNSAASEFNKLNQDYVKKYSKGGQPSEAEYKKLTAAQEKMRTGVIAQLTSTQLKRLREITLQDAGLIALTDPNVAKEVGLSTGQVKQINDAFQKGMADSAKIIRTSQESINKQFANRKPKTDKEKNQVAEEYRKKMESEMKRVKPQIDKIEKSTNSKVLGVLSKSQAAKYNVLLGAPFKRS